MSGKHILIIDNLVKTRGAMSQLFAEMGCETMTTRDEATGLAAAHNGEFDLVILGSDLSETACSELMRSLKEHNPNVMVLTLNGNGSAPREVLQAVEAALEPLPDPRAPYPVQSSLRDVEKVHIERVLEHKRWNQSAAAKALGVDRKTLRNKMREFMLERSD